MYGCNLDRCSILWIDRLAKKWASMYKVKGLPRFSAVPLERRVGLWTETSYSGTRHNNKIFNKNRYLQLNILCATQLRQRLARHVMKCERTVKQNNNLTFTAFYQLRQRINNVPILKPTPRNFKKPSIRFWLVKPNVELRGSPRFSASPAWTPGWAERYVKTLSQPQHSNNKLLNINNGIQKTATALNNCVSG
jgi:hypothetical protein